MWCPAYAAYCFFLHSHNTLILDIFPLALLDVDIHLAVYLALESMIRMATRKNVIEKLLLKTRVLEDAFLSFEEASTFCVWMTFEGTWSYPCVLVAFVDVRYGYKNENLDIIHTSWSTIYNLENAYKRTKKKIAARISTPGTQISIKSILRIYN